ncbi:hypothetical protein BGZ63DRAFT_424610 [Mariannaea sp. PMI_226]|nr:hypothetical protein BGZ63DRAFT_424610 [Mariannaea sp. PMI_226]
MTDEEYEDNEDYGSPPTLTLMMAALTIITILASALFGCYNALGGTAAACATFASRPKQRIFILPPPSNSDFRSAMQVHWLVIFSQSSDRVGSICVKATVAAVVD